jgi:DNA-binding HxlR family transcriptional regulator
MTAGTPLFDNAEDILQDMQEIVGRKWHPILLYYLLTDGSMGFSELKNRVDGISSKMLSESLDDLEEAGLVARDLLNDKPVRVEYSLTEHGASLEPLVSEMVRWGSEHADRLAEDDTDESSSSPVEPPATPQYPAVEGR